MSSYTPALTRSATVDSLEAFETIFPELEALTTADLAPSTSTSSSR